MRRKLVKQGAATLMISLPSKWIKQYNLDKGDEIELEELDSNLIISKEKTKIKSETQIKITNLTESSIRTLITNTYRKGYEKIKVIFDNETKFNILRKIIKTRLIGFEITNKEPNSCTVENITEPSQEQFDIILNKMFMNIEELFEITEKKLTYNTEEILEDFEEIEERIQKYDNFCRRVINKRKYSEQKSELLWTFLTLIIHAQREIYHMNKIIIKNLKVSSETITFLKKSKEIFELLIKAYKEKEVSILEKIHEMEKELIYKQAYTLLEKTKSKESILIYHIASSIRQFYLASSPLMGILI